MWLPRKNLLILLGDDKENGQGSASANSSEKRSGCGCERIKEGVNKAHTGVVTIVHYPLLYESV